MKRKNGFDYIVFTDANGAAEIKGERLLASFEEERCAFQMDYDNPREGFTGEITAKILSVGELKNALGAYEMFRGRLSFPSDYADRIKVAMSLGDQANSHKVEVYA